MSLLLTYVLIADNQLVSEVPMYVANLMGQAREFPSLCCWCYVPETIHPTFMKTCPQSHPGFTCYITLLLATGQVRLGLVLLGLSIMSTMHYFDHNPICWVSNLNPNPKVGGLTGQIENGMYWVSRSTIKNGADPKPTHLLMVLEMSTQTTQKSEGLTRTLN